MISRQEEQIDHQTEAPSNVYWAPLEFFIKRKYLLHISVFIVGTFFLISLIGVLYLPLEEISAKLTNRNYNGEGLIELIEAICWLATSLVLLYLFFHDIRENGFTLGTFFFLFFFIFSFIAFGEEISWGQHIIGFKTPEAIKEINKQGETNLHNLNISELLGLSKENLFSGLLTNFTFLLNPLFYLGCFTIGFIIPILKIKNLLPRIKIFETWIFPSRGTVTFCGIAFIFLEIWDRVFFDVGELIELSFSLIFLLYARDIAISIKNRHLIKVQTDG
jgi:hypothetical protein